MMPRAVLQVNDGELMPPPEVPFVQLSGRQKCVFELAAALPSIFAGAWLYAQWDGSISAQTVIEPQRAVMPWTLLGEAADVDVYFFPNYLQIREQQLGDFMAFVVEEIRKIQSKFFVAVSVDFEVIFLRGSGIHVPSRGRVGPSWPVDQPLPEIRPR